MAPQHTQQENSMSGGAIMPMMEQEEGEEEEEDHRHGDRPLLLASEKEEQQDASKPLPLPVKRSRSLRSSRGEQGREEAAAPRVRSMSFSRLFSSFRMTATSSSTIDQLAAAEDGCAEQWQWRSQSKRHHQQQPKPVCRTQSLPMTSIPRRLPPHGHRKRVADSSSLRRFRVSLSSVPFPVPESSPPPPPPSSEANENKEEDEEVGEEEAVCRICMVALEEEEEGGSGGGGVLKLECRCKGELALAHRGCALKWFRIKGNTNCDVCGHDVLNLPVTLRRLPPPLPPPPPPPHPNNGSTTTSQEEERAAAGGGGLRRVWRHGTAVLVVVSMLAYFCFLEQLLVDDHGAAVALAVSLPFAVVLGTFSVLTTARMVSSRRYVWAYSALQFLLVVLFTHLFYRYVRLQAVIAIILSTFAGFGVAICANAMLLQVIRWRAAAATRRPPPPLEEDPGLHQIPQP